MINGGSIGYLSFCGAEADQIDHLLFMGIRVAEIAPDKNGQERRRVLPFEGVDGDDSWAMRQELERYLLAGLHDLSTWRSDAVEHHFATLPARARSPVPLDPVTVDLVTGMGISPAWLRLLATTVDDFEITLCDNVKASVIVQREIVTIPLGRIGWSGDRVDFGRYGLDVPETLFAAAQGRRLREVVSHPVLDRHPIRMGAALDPVSIGAWLEDERLAA